MVDWFLPGFKAGGPIQSVANMAKALKDDVNVYVFTSDRDHMEEAPYPNIDCDKWTQRAHCKVFYSSPEAHANNIGVVLDQSDWDAIYLNSFFSFRFAVKPLLELRKRGLLSKVIMAPRGMLGEGALSLKPVKKKGFVAVFKMLGLHRKIRFHATDDFEQRSIEKALGNGAGIQVLPNVPYSADSGSNTKRHIPFLFASRVSPKKNLQYAIKRLASVATEKRLDVYGTADDLDYLEACQQEADKNDLGVTFNDAVPHQELMTLMMHSRFFILPTLNENFGHAIVEAMANGCVPIISDQTPWQDLEERGAGWVIPLDQPNKWESVLERAGQMSEEEFSGFSKRAAEYYQKTFDISEIRTKYLELFSDQNRP